MPLLLAHSPLKEGEYHLGLTLALLNDQRVRIKHYLATSFLVITFFFQNSLSFPAV